jgi:hypothetical protein
MDRDDFIELEDYYRHLCESLEEPPSGFVAVGNGEWATRLRTCGFCDEDPAILVAASFCT